MSGLCKGRTRYRPRIPVSEHWLQWIVAYLIVIAILFIGAGVQEYLAWRKEQK
ncbi:hypothetical protein SAMN05444171_7886 [Bradyrhizobium lablabi]|uniref:Uncharacterized protein n=1 Tax=Bradyrhizobium lablabi TaxID=722472 RepID=A0A1H5JGY1_9BRAD|nr:hypothetical protein SAMN05444171_7819 [Bradyrhizobium lablabi]SEE53236.1 hypothetical protein SAMN05444171_7886 [Bradyrhizobium lablabi]